MYLFSRIGHLKKIIFKGRGFRCGSDEKMMRMWFGLEIDVVGLPPLGDPNKKKIFLAEVYFHLRHGIRSV